MATPPEDADDYNQLVARIAGLSQENTNIENFAFSVTPSASSDDLFAQLQQKELDLKLTAELGKALLDKNEDLQRRNEQLVEEYSQRLEELTQEKHELRLRLEAIEGQYELTVHELQHEVTQLRDDLADQDETMRVGERTHTQELQDAKQHNEQLSEQMHKVRGSEAVLQGQVDELREQLRTRRISMQDYLHKVEALREEIGKLTAIRIELEQRINILTSERNMHVCSLEDMHDRIVALERHKQEQEEQLMCQEREINELREQNLCLQDNVGHLTLQSTSDLTLEAGGCSNSLFRELHLSNTKSTSTESLDADAFSRKSVDLRQEIVEVYKLMKQMVNDLEDGEVHQGHKTPSDSPQVEPQLALAEVLTGGLQSLLRKLHQQMEHAVNIRVNQLMRPTMEKLQHLEPLERKVQELQNELDAAMVALNDFNYQAHQSTSTSDLTAEADGDDSLLSATKTTSTESLDTDAFSQRTTCLTHEVVEVYQQMKQMVNDLGGGEMGHGHATHLCSQVEPQQALSEVQSGVLQSLLRKLREQMEHAVNIRVNQLMQPTPEQLRHNEGLEQKVEQLQNELTRAEAADNKLKVELKLREMELKRKSDEFMQLTSEIKLTTLQLSLQQQELVTLQIERDRLQDQSAGVITRDDIIEQARQSRDDAISRRNAMEVELARAKLDLMNLDRQLMDAIQQKLQLSQQLEQWQMDMQELVDTQMMKRMELESKKVERSHGGPQSALRKFKFSWS